MTIKEQLQSLLQEHFNPTKLEVEDQSHLHAGHAGAPDRAETHFDVTIVSDAFVGQSRVTRHQMVYTVLEGLMETNIHALSLKLLTPEEYEEKKQG